MRQRKTLCKLFAVLSIAMLLAVGVSRSAPVAQAQTSFDCSTVTEIPQTECEDLVLLYNSTDGPNWTNNTGWLSSTTPCSWYGVDCTSYVISLSLSNNQLSGEIPNLANLPYLYDLSLYDNQLSGEIPNFNLPNLTDLRLSDNQLSGPIPNFSNLPNLTYLDLSVNQLSGTIPDFSNLPNLTDLSLYDNQLSGPIPDFSNLPNLTDLRLFNNQLSGPIPDFSNLPYLYWLYLYNNQLSGPIPDFSNLPNLEWLHLNYNQLSGVVPNRDWSGFFSLYFSNNCGLVAYDAAQATVLSGKDADWQVQNPDCRDDYEPNDSSSQAKTISSGVSQNHSLSPVGDVDWLKFTVTADSVVALETAGASGDTRMWLYDSSLNQIAFNDDGGQGTFSRIDYSCLAAGTYYVKVDEYNNDAVIDSYTIGLTLTDCPTSTPSDEYEPNDSSSQAKTISSGTSQSHNIIPVGDVDWLKFTATTDSALLLETAGASGDTRMWLYDSSLNEITFDDDGGQNNFSRIDYSCLSAGTYYVKVDEYNNDAVIDSYTIGLTLTDCPTSTPSDEYEPNDSSSQAKTISSGASQSHNIIPVGDVDWLKFTATTDSALLLETAGASGDTRMWLYDSSLNEITFDDDGGQNYFSQISLSCDQNPLSSGSYYVKVDEYGNDNTIDDYTVSLTLTDCPAVLTVDKSSLSFSATQGGSNPTGQTFNISNSGSGTLNWTVSTNQSWLSVSPASGSNNGTVTVSVDITALTATGSPYSGQITVDGGSADNSPQTITVDVTITESPEPQLNLTTDAVDFGQQQLNSSSSAQTVTLQNSGDANLDISSMTIEGDFSQTNNCGATLTPTESCQIELTFTPTASGNRTGLLTITSNAPSTPDTISLSGQGIDPTLSLSTSSLTFSTTPGKKPADQTFTISNIGSEGSLNWTVSHDLSWLDITPKTGQDSGLITVSVVNLDSLNEGEHSGTITVSSDEATNSPQTVPVILTVASDPILAVQPTSLSFETVVGTNPAAKTINISNTGTGSLAWTASTTASWLSLSATAGDAPTELSVAVDVSGLAPGTYRDTLTIDGGVAQGSPLQLPVMVTIDATPKPDLLVTPLVDSPVCVGQTAQFTATVANQGLAEAAAHTLDLYQDETLLQALAVDAVPAGESVSVLYTLTPDTAGSYSLKAVVDSTSIVAETDETNNIATVSMVVQADESAPTGSLSINEGADSTSTTQVNLTLAATDTGPCAGDALEMRLSSDGTTWQAWQPFANTMAWTLPDTEGSHTVYVQFRDEAGNISPSYSDSITLSLPQPELTVSPETVSFTVQEGQTDSATLQVSNSGSGSLEWTATAQAAWLTVSPASGTDAGAVTVSANATDLAAGSYTGQVVIESNGGAVTLPVTLVVEEISKRICSGDELAELMKQANQAGATIELDGSCRYVLTEVYGSSSGIDIRQDNVTLNGNGAIIERAESASEFRLIFVRANDVTMKNLTIKNGKTKDNGGGLWLYQDSSLTVDRVFFINNQAKRGGAIRANSGSTITILNSLFSHNFAIDGGTAFSASGGEATLHHITVSDNSLNPQSAIFTFGDLTLYNSVIANHDTALAAAGGITYTVVEDYNAFSGNLRETKKYNEGTTIDRGEHSLVVENSNFVDPTNNNYRPQRGSPLIDKGMTLSINMDADGETRPYPGTMVDIGAYEYQGQGGPALSVVKYGPRWVKADSQAIYTLIVKNQGLATAMNLQLTDSLPSGAEYVEASEGGQLENGVVSWNLGDLAIDASKTVQLVVTATQALTFENYQVVSLSEPDIKSVGDVVFTPLNQQLEASNGFLPKPDGYSFSNWGGDTRQTDFTTADVERLFGATKVCKTNNPCVLTAAAEQWRKAQFDWIKEGRCSGMSATSMRFFNGSASPSDFDSEAAVTFDLDLDSSRHTINYYAISQNLTNKNHSAGDWLIFSDRTPNGVLDFLIDNLNDSDSTGYTLGFRKRDGSGGHEVVPYAIEDRGNDNYWVYVYDNNYPNNFDRVVKINRNKNSWLYEGGATNPDALTSDYEGDASTDSIYIKNLAYREVLPKVCTFCTGSTTGRQADVTVLQLMLSGEAYMLITNEQGQQLGYNAEGQFINEIPNAIDIPLDAGLGFNTPPMLQIPYEATTKLTIELFSVEPAYGQTSSLGNLTLIGQGYVVTLEDLKFDTYYEDLTTNLTHESLRVVFDPTAKMISYTSSEQDSDTPAMVMAISQEDGADYTIKVDGMTISPNHTITMTFDEQTGELSFSDDDNDTDTYNVEVERLNSDGTTDLYNNNDVAQGEGTGVTIDLGNWDGQTEPEIILQTGTNNIYLPILTK